MFSHISVGTNDLPRAIAFYTGVLAPLGIVLKARRQQPERAIFAHPDSDVVFCVYSPLDGQPASVGNGSLVAFEARTRHQVDSFHARALQHGGADEGAPGLRLHYSPTYYGAYVRDLDGNKLCCVCHLDE
ncbi:catechol 2,3-dioxygenase-like lactoylglutathione lyase family enzyme [Pseudomonas nitritireducens]|uniref:Catechol 2,3-dioxygenase-like lactoylglutathione lyase family enzyme n=1 Tax=Pseudomonas nitroreducens TaxID=46680 RepID=A0A7W7KQF2_PSENT|nr:VOC family protein [Pseudomonas nitritireducens]MBB4866649.1 catechol 2,3-dioxygenase-like lactoylglutathione lyase family enzyme [Pseudomonas nitritireducens]